IALNALTKIGAKYDDRVIDVITQHAYSGRDAVNMVQIAEGLVLSEGKDSISQEDVEWVVNSGHYLPRPLTRVSSDKIVGAVNGLAVYGPHLGSVMDIEARAFPVAKGEGKLVVTGIVEEEEIGQAYGQRLKRKSMARSSLENVLTVLGSVLELELSCYHIHINFPGGSPVDGPSAGLALVALLYSAIKNEPIPNDLAFTGEVSVRGMVRPVGGVTSKIDAAVRAGVKKVFIPKANYQSYFASYPLDVISVTNVEEMLDEVFGKTNYLVASGSLVTSANG
ncbi:MAG: S16 family serine protease, partial [Bacillota bacterium]